MIAHWYRTCNHMYMVVNKPRLPALYRQRHIPTHGAHMGSHKMCTNKPSWQTLSTECSGSQVIQTTKREAQVTQVHEHSHLESGRHLFTNRGWKTPLRSHSIFSFCMEGDHLCHIYYAIFCLVLISERGPHGLLVRSASDYRLSYFNLLYLYFCTQITEIR